jgi:hypothetical protein
MVLDGRLWYYHIAMIYETLSGISAFINIFRALIAVFSYKKNLFTRAEHEQGASKLLILLG